MLSFVFLALFSSHRDGPSDATWRFWSAREGSAEQNPAPSSNASLCSQRYPTRTRRPLRPPPVRIQDKKSLHGRGPRKRVGPPSDGEPGVVYAGQVQLLPMPCPCVTLAAGSTTRRFHEVFMQVIYVSLSLLVNFVLQQG